MLHHNNVQDGRSFTKTGPRQDETIQAVCADCLSSPYLLMFCFKCHISSPGVCLTLCLVLSLGLGFTDWDNQSRQISHYRIRTCRHVKICKFARHLWDLCPYLHLSGVQIWKFTADNHARSEASFPRSGAFVGKSRKLKLWALSAPVLVHQCVCLLLLVTNVPQYLHPDVRFLFILIILMNRKVKTPSVIFNHWFTS